MVEAGLKASAAKLPNSCGIYIFRGEVRGVLYVGKAKRLRARVSQYLSGHDERPQVAPLVAEATSVEVVLTDNEKEALLLENTLIKKHRPPFNIQLKDDKNFLHLSINTGARWPRFVLRREIRHRRGVRTFGPWSSARHARSIASLLERTFPLRTCDDRTLKGRSRPCLQYEMKRCLGPCVEGLTTEERYAEVLSDALMFMEGKRKELKRELTERMGRHAEALEFEEAAALRDTIVAIEKSMERQKVIDPKLGDRDAWGLSREGGSGVLLVLPVRKGMLIEPTQFPFRGALAEDGDLLATLLTAHYSASFIPREVLLPIEAPPGLEELLSEQKGQRVHLTSPQRGDKARLLSLAQRNAASRFERSFGREERQLAALDELAEVCELSAPPGRIECYDNSNIQGSSPVASQVVFVDGAPAKQHYRSYSIKSVVGPDDYASMAEVLRRRLKRGLENDDLPDLIVVDGGRGQLNVAVDVLAELDISRVAVIGLAKPRSEQRRGEHDAVDKIVLPHSDELKRLPDHSPALNLLRRLRDESHRFALQYHRKKRRKGSLTSSVLKIPGVGPARRTALLRHFGSLKALKAASPEEIAKVEGIGEGLAQTIAEGLK